jgi:hypothetical protein
MYINNKNFDFKTFNSTKDTRVPATLVQVLDAANLLKSYNDFCVLYQRADMAFQQGKIQTAYNIIYKIWMSPTMIPALLLLECFYSGELIVPNWNFNGKLFLQKLKKASGGTRPIVVPNKQLRVCMAAVNILLQASCSSWSMRTTGFRPDYGTQNAIDMVANTVQDKLAKYGNATLVSFDLKTAFNSVHLHHLCTYLDLKQLPSSMKNLIWNWQHLHVKGTVNPADGLCQGFAYSPTLFAWYLDTVFVNQSSFIAYADNLVGVFENMQQAQDQLNKAEALLKNIGLLINRDTVMFKTVNYTSHPDKFIWLAHEINLPDCVVTYNKHNQNQQKTEPTVITISQWKDMLQSTNWVHKALNSNWRNIHKQRSW